MQYDGSFEIYFTQLYFTQYICRVKFFLYIFVYISASGGIFASEQALIDLYHYRYYAGIWFIVIRARDNQRGFMGLSDSGAAVQPDVW